MSLRQWSLSTPGNLEHDSSVLIRWGGLYKRCQKSVLSTDISGFGIDKRGLPRGVYIRKTLALFQYKVYFGKRQKSVLSTEVATF